jgi:hypothetical protein
VNASKHAHLYHSVSVHQTPAPYLCKNGQREGLPETPVKALESGGAICCHCYRDACGVAVVDYLTRERADIADGLFNKFLIEICIEEVIVISRPHPSARPQCPFEAADRP